MFFVKFYTNQTHPKVKRCVEQSLGQFEAKFIPDVGEHVVVYREAGLQICMEVKSRKWDYSLSTVEIELDIPNDQVEFQYFMNYFEPKFFKS